MKRIYPKYHQGELDEVYNSLIEEDKKALEKYLQKCSISSNPKKVGQIKKLVIQLKDITEKPLTKQNLESVNSFLVLLNNADKSDWTKAEIKIYVKGFLKFHYKDLELIENFKLNLKKQLNPQKITENNLVTEEDIEKMLRFASGYKDKCYLLLSFSTGARPQELYNLTWGNIKFEDDYADITLFSGKTGKSRIFPIVDETKNALWEWKQHYSFSDVSKKDYVFPSHQRNKPITTAGLNKMLRVMSKKAGIEKDVWGYLMRHTRATKLYEELPQQIVEKLMGHKNMAGIYAHISTKKAREVMLKKVYHIEELTKEEKKEIVKLKTKILEMEKQMELMSHSFKLDVKKLKSELFSNFNEEIKLYLEKNKNIHSLKALIEGEKKKGP